MLELWRAIKGPYEQVSFLEESFNVHDVAITLKVVPTPSWDGVFQQDHHSPSMPISISSVGNVVVRDEFRV